jgi:GMP synthase-like glutamine amidotransferase
MILLINCTVKNETSLSAIPKLRTALRTLRIPYYEVRGPNVRPEVMDPSSSIYKNITGIIISGSSMKLSQIGKDVSKYVYILHYLRLFQRVPVLGICFGAQLLLTLYGGSLIDNHVYTRRSVEVQVLKSHRLFQGLGLGSGPGQSSRMVACFNFSDIPVITNRRRIKPIAWVVGNTSSLPVAYEFERGRVYGCLFHPELNPDTYAILKNTFSHI